ncbi:MAG: acyl-CoA thioesterase [Muribaculaceae bacterium]|nr:acyl-CoA thioesterase [Muribaculaceae bacterium]
MKDSNNKKYCFQLEMEVRDYELDCEQIVNNANYLHYMEHTRHKFCQEAGLPFIEMHKNGIDAVVRKIEMEYFTPLMSGDKFLSCIRIERKGPRYIFYQDIYKLSGEKVIEGIVTAVILKDGKLSRGDEIADVFSKYLD